MCSIFPSFYSKVKAKLTQEGNFKIIKETDIKREMQKTHKNNFGKDVPAQIAVILNSKLEEEEKKVFLAFPVVYTCVSFMSSYHWFVFYLVP